MKAEGKSHGKEAGSTQTGVHDDGKVANESYTKKDSNDQSKDCKTEDSTKSYESPTKKQKRAICSRCDRPTPSACICAALPSKRISLNHCHCIVLEHPHESKRKNRSLPLVQLCLDQDGMTVAKGRRFGNQSTTIRIVIDNTKSKSREDNGSSSATWLIFPGDDSISMTQALRERKHNQRVFLIFLDATWKHAKEMDRANIQHKQYPTDMIRVQLTEADLPSTNFIPRRFDIRTPISDHHLSTAECLARFVAMIEDGTRKSDKAEESVSSNAATNHVGEDLFLTLMKPLDLMVEQWHQFMGEMKERNTKAKTK